MATVQEFESTLKEVMNGKRLSASKMAKLTELSMKLMQHDTQLISLLYRTHKSLPASSKISSLYCFDALCRNARAYVIKHKLTGDINAEKGNAASFLLKIEGVLDGLFQDMLSSGIPEAKDKTKKVLDIWTKSNAFPTDVLTRLSAIGRKAETPQETKPPAVPTVDPRKQVTPPAEVARLATSTPPTAEAAQAALLALLSAASASNNTQPGQTSTNNITPPAVVGTGAQQQTDQMQTALLRQLAQIAGTSAAPAQASSSAAVTNAVPFSPTYATPTSALPSSAFPGSSARSPPKAEAFERTDESSRPSRFDSNSGTGRGFGRDREPPSNRQGSHRRDSPPPRGDYHSRDGHRGGSRTGGRDRDRGRGGRRWGGRDSGDKHQSSRSRSPQYRRGGGPNGRKHSPARRSPVDRPKAMDSGKDEFGRDVRSASAEPEQSSRPTDPRRPPGYSKPKPAIEEKESKDTQYTQQGTTTVSSSGGGLENFDITSFDPTNADCWRTLGDAYQVTNGYLPSQEELMEFVMSSMSYMMSMGMGVGTGAGIGMGQMDTMPAAQEDTNTPSIGAQDWGADTYGGGTQGQIAPLDMMSKTDVQGNEDDGEPNTSGGKMQRVGDRWVFVRDGAKV